MKNYFVYLLGSLVAYQTNCVRSVEHSPAFVRRQLVGRQFEASIRVDFLLHARQRDRVRTLLVGVSTSRPRQSHVVAIVRNGNVSHLVCAHAHVLLAHLQIEPDHVQADVRVLVAHASVLRVLRVCEHGGVRGEWRECEACQESSSFWYAKIFDFGRVVE